METSISRAGKRPPGRPRTDAISIHLRIVPKQLIVLDAWIAAQPDPKPSRPEAIRRLVEAGLAQDNSLSRLYRDTLQTSLERAEQDPTDEVERGWAALYRDLIAKVPSADELQEWFVHAINDRVERLAHDRERAEKRRGRKPT